MLGQIVIADRRCDAVVRIRHEVAVVIVEIKIEIARCFVCNAADALPHEFGAAAGAEMASAKWIVELDAIVSDACTCTK